MMDVQKTKAPLTTRRHDGFTIVEILFMTTILAIVTMFGLMGIARARASVRLSGAAREYATHIEKARMHSIRNHADDAADRASVAISEAKNSYTITLDRDGNGTLDTETITLPSDVTFETVETIAFDWRGRTVSIVDGVTTTNAQVSIRLNNGSSSVSIDVTGSGDITVDSKVFDDSVPNVNLRVGDLASNATPTPTPVSSVPTATPDGTVNGSEPTPTPTPVSDQPVGISPGGGGGGTPTPTPTPAPSPSPSPSPSPTPSPSPSPSPVEPCSITTDAETLSISLDGTKTIKVSHSSTTSITITGTSSKSSDLQITPGGAQTVAAGGSTTFTIKSKRAIGVYGVTFTAGCGSKTVPVLVVGLLGL